MDGGDGGEEEGKAVDRWMLGNLRDLFSMGHHEECASPVGPSGRYCAR